MVNHLMIFNILQNIKSIPTLSSFPQHPHDNYHHTIPLKRISTHPTDILYDNPIYRKHQ